MTLRTVTFDDEQWQVVPREPNEAMVKAGLEASLTANKYLAMLDAAPEPPASMLTQQKLTRAINALGIDSRAGTPDYVLSDAIWAYLHGIPAKSLPAQPRRPYGTDTMSEYSVIPECDGPKPPAQEPMEVAEIEDQSSYWHRWYLKTREELYAVRQGWIRVVDEFLVTRHLGIARPTDTYDEARAKLLKIIDFEIDIATDPVVGGDRVRKKVPMTDEEAKALISPVLRRVPAGNLPQISTGYLIAMMRAVERHHGIGKGESNEG